MPDATAELDRAAADIPLTRSAREILDRAASAAKARGSSASPNDVLQAILSSRGSLAYEAISALGIDPSTVIAQLPTADGAQPIPIRQLLVNANREAQVLGHYQVDSIHLLLAMLYS
ncbi:MAG: Clp protease N-terminal domain-containing protein, partial [Solirubrobacterales bacterium]